MKKSMTKKYASKVLAGALGLGLLCSSAHALPFIGIEGGGIVSTELKSGQDMKFSYGAYGRLWIKLPIRLAPFVKWEVIGDKFLYNLQYGGVVGYALFGMLTPYVGASYSTFNRDFQNTWAINYGLHFTIPLVPLAVSFDGSWQELKPFTGGKISTNRIGVLIGLQF